MCYRPHLAWFLYDTEMCLVVQCYKIWATLVKSKIAGPVLLDVGTKKQKNSVTWL